MTERIKMLDEIGTELARVAVDAEREPRKPSALAGHLLRPSLRARMLAAGLAVVVLLGGGVYAVPVTRAAADSIVDSLAAWVSGDSGAAPGHAIEAGDNLPSWFYEEGQARVIARTGGVGLYVRRSDTDQGPWLDFGLGKGLGVTVGDSLEKWRERFDQHAVFVLGPTPFGPRNVLDERARFPLLGVTARDVERVELRYSEGPPLTGKTGDGGFVLLADAWRPLRELIAYDASGRVLERTDVSELDMRYLCEKDPVCPTQAP